MEFEFTALVKGYLSYLRDVSKLKPRTIVDVRCTLKNAVCFSRKRCNSRELWELKLDELVLWMDQLKDEGKSQSSINKQLSHVRGILEYAMRTGHSRRNVLDGFFIKYTDKFTAPRVLTEEETKQLITAMDNKNKCQRRDRLIILLLYGCGLRTAEVCSLDVGDIDHQRREVVVRHGKNDIQRRIPVPAELWTEILAYLAQRGGARGALFKTFAKRKRIHSKDVLCIVRDAVDRAGLEGKITPKTLRHTFASHLMDAGVNVAVIAVLMGHRSPRETGVYIHALKGKREEAVKILGSGFKKEEE